MIKMVILYFVISINKLFLEQAQIRICLKDLIGRMLCIDPNSRNTARVLRRHPFFVLDYEDLGNPQKYAEVLSHMMSFTKEENEAYALWTYPYVSKNVDPKDPSKLIFSSSSRFSVFSSVPDAACLEKAIMKKKKKNIPNNRPIFFKPTPETTEFEGKDPLEIQEMEDEERYNAKKKKAEYEGLFMPKLATIKPRPFKRFLPLCTFFITFISSFFSIFQGVFSLFIVFLLAIHL